MQWHLFLPWMTMWASTCLACMGVGLYIGYGAGVDSAEIKAYTDSTDTDQVV